MIHQEPEETMQKSLDESVGCLSAKDVHCNSKDSTDVIEELPEKKDEASANRNGLLESDNSFNRETFVPLNQGYNRPFYNQECRAWPKFHPDFEKLRACHTLETHFYPVHRDPYLVENRNYMPLKMYSQGYPHEFQFQEFEYFVVIDFEATCDKDKNLHPQEIIEFPSVLVNSVTGQLEASFQTYVRPSYHQHLSEFCKELTGIQQIQKYPVMVYRPDLTTLGLSSPCFGLAHLILFSSEYLLQVPFGRLNVGVGIKENE